MSFFKFARKFYIQVCVELNLSFVYFLFLDTIKVMHIDFDCS